MKKIKIIFTCVCLMLSTTVCNASWQYYNEEANDTSGGTNGSVYVVRHVYRESVSYSGYSVNYYGVEGYIDNGNTLTTTWTSYGYLYKTNSHDYLNTLTNTVNCHRRYKGLTGQDSYVTYSLHLNSNDSAFGSSIYYKNGSF
ncbi:MAG: hypothetical protein IJM14_11020 [Lachnospiraceae bacterium]|nr:hypothetical protein [Lachnospiraceae bacterium]